MKPVAIFACLLGACSPVFSGCSAFGQLSPDARDALTAAGRIAEKSEPCLRALFASEQKTCEQALTEDEKLACKADAASKFVAAQADRDTVKDYSCEHSTEVTFAGECGP